MSPNAIAGSAVGTSLLALFVAVTVIGSVALLVISNRRKNDRIETKQEFVAYGSLKNWYNQSPNFLFKALRAMFGSIPESTTVVNDVAEAPTGAIEVPKSTVANLPTGWTNLGIADDDVYGIGHEYRLTVAQFVIDLFNSDVSPLLAGALHLGDLTELKHRMQDVETNLFGEGPQYVPASLKDYGTARSARYSALARLLVNDMHFMKLCVLYAGVLEAKYNLACDINKMPRDLRPYASAFEAFTSTRTLSTN